MPDACSGADGSSRGGNRSSDSAAQAPTRPSTAALTRPARRTRRAAGPGGRVTVEMASKRAGDHQPDRCGNGEAGVGAVEQHPRRGQGVQTQEPGRGQEGHRHEQHPGIGPAAGGHAGGVGDAGVHDAGRQHQPEVGRMVLPVLVEVGVAHQQGQAQHRQRHHADQRQRPTGRRSMAPLLERRAVQVVSCAHRVIPVPTGWRRGSSCNRHSCSWETTTEPSPTAAPTRFTERWRTSPMANTRGTLVSKGSGRRSRGHAPPARSSRGPGRGR